MNLRQKKFADEYIISGNASKSALKAGYSEKYAAVNADKLLKNTKVKEYIEERIKKIDKKTIAKQEEVLEYLTAVMRGEKKDVVLYGTGNGMQAKTTLDVANKERIKAAELLGKRYKLFTDRVDVSSDVDMNLDVKVDYGD